MNATGSGIALPPGVKPKDPDKIVCENHWPVVAQYKKLANGDLIAKLMVCYNCGMVQVLPPVSRDEEEPKQ